MPLLLTIDTATENAVISVAENERVIYSLTNTHQKDHASFLQPGIKTLLTESKVLINQLNAVYTADPISTTLSTITAPGSTGRGTAVLTGTDPAVSYAIVYYIIDNNTALLLDSDTVSVGIGAIARQF